MDIRYCTLLLSSILLTSCDFHVVAQGVVVDELTQQQLSAVEVSFGKRLGHVVYSDTNGYFNMSFIIGATFSPPKELALIFQKEGYATDTVLVPLVDTMHVMLRRLP